MSKIRKRSNKISKIQAKKFLSNYICKYYSYIGSVQKFVPDLLFKFQTAAIFVKNEIKSKAYSV